MSSQSNIPQEQVVIQNAEITDSKETPTLLISPKRPRNIKNLQLDLSLSPRNHSSVKPIALSPDDNNSINSNAISIPMPSFTSSGINSSSNPTTNNMFRTTSINGSSSPSSSSSLFRTPSLSLKSMKSPLSSSNPVNAPLKRRNTTQLALSIPIRSEPVPQTISNNTIHNNNNDNNNNNNNNNNASMIGTSTSTSTATITETLSYNPNVKNYPNGPICVLEPNLFLYSEPDLQILSQFDVIFNVASELKDYSHDLSRLNPNIEYHFVPWTHTSKLSTDFPNLTKLLDDALSKNQRVLIHCQCGVSRSASLIIAYYMKFFKIGYNEAYQILKTKAPSICPNLTLIFDLMEWGQVLGFNSIPLSPSPTSHTNKQNISSPSTSYPGSATSTQSNDNIFL